jgi:bifunctional non-homologous end joining protein LigD
VHRASRLFWSSCIIEGELVACDGAGVPHFYALHFHSRNYALCVWAFDLLHYNGRDLRELPLCERKATLEKLICGANVPIGCATRRPSMMG